MKSKESMFRFGCIPELWKRTCILMPNRLVRKNVHRKITTTKHYEVHRKGTAKYVNIPTDASSAMPDDLMDSIEPYDYKEMTKFEMEYLPGYLADKYDVSKKIPLSVHVKEQKIQRQARLRKPLTVMIKCRKERY